MGDRRRSGGAGLAIAICALWLAAPAPAVQNAYLSNYDGGGIAAAGVEADGGLVPLPDSPFGGTESTQSEGVGITPDARYLYSPDFIENELDGFQIQPDGALTSVPGSPFETDDFPIGVAPTADREYVYVSNQGSSGGSVSAFSIGLGGELTELSGSPFPVAQATGLALAPDGEHLYVASDAGDGR